METHQIHALDSKFNAYRAPNDPSFKNLYAKCRMQLLQNDRTKEGSPFLKTYCEIRATLLHKRYGLFMEKRNPKAVVPNSRSFSKSFIDTRSERSSRLGTPSERSLFIRNAIASSSIAKNYAFSAMYHIFDQHKDSVTKVKFAHNDSTLLACSSLDGTISICKLDNKESGPIHTLKAHTAGVTGFDWSCSNDLLVSSGMDGMLCLWDAHTGLCLRSTYDRKKKQILCGTFHPINSNWVVAGNSGGMVEVINMSTGLLPPRGTCHLPGAIGAMQFDSTGVMLYVGNNRGTIFSFKFNMISGQLNKSRHFNVADGFCITSICVRSWAQGNAHATYVLANVTNNMIYVFRVVDNEGTLKSKVSYPIPHSSLQIQSIFSPLISNAQGSCVVSGSEDGKIWVLDIERDNNPLINKLLGHSAPVLSVSFSYDESFLASSDASGLVIIWQRQSP